MRLVMAEGTPGELAQFARESDLMIPIPTKEVADAQERIHDNDSAEPVWLDDFLATRSGEGSTETRMARLFVQKVLQTGKYEVKRGTSKRSDDGYGDYLQIRRLGRQNVGALAYVTPSSRRCDLRLEKESAADHEHAEVIKPERSGVYNVRVYLSSEAAVEEAVSLLEAALELAMTWPAPEEAAAPTD